MAFNFIDGLQNSMGFTSLGIMQRINTGHPMLDMLLIALAGVLVPALVSRQLSPEALWERLSEWVRRRFQRRRFWRHVQSVTREGRFGTEPQDDGYILQTAILLYLGSRKDIVAKSEEGEVIVWIADKPKNDDGAGDYSTLNCVRLNTAPAKDFWIDVEDGIRLRRIEGTHMGNNEKHSRETTTVIELFSDRPNGHELIQQFVDKCLKYYQDVENDMKDQCRYLYMPLAAGEEGTKFKRYKLSEEKTFESYFHQEKDALLRLVDQFMSKSGKFAIPGYPHKLGLLLHGPPGTGKTSLIKALAHYTRRSIVSVPLSKVKTNQELMNIMFDQSFEVTDDSMPKRLPHSKVIFVMEDLDGDGSVVLDRKKGRAADKRVNTVNATADEAPDSPAGFTPKANFPASPDALGFTNEKGSGHQGGANASHERPGSDALDIAGVLNVIDGVVDSPDRILIMTSNHPEHLDRALIRPGRINKRLYLGDMAPESACSMVRHLFPEASDAEMAALHEVLAIESNTHKLVPAKLEAMCAEYDTVGSLTERLQRGVGSADLGETPAELAHPTTFADARPKEEPKRRGQSQIQPAAAPGQVTKRPKRSLLSKGFGFR